MTNYLNIKIHNFFTLSSLITLNAFHKIKIKVERCLEEELENLFQKKERECNEIKKKIKKLKVIPGIGNRLAHELLDMGYHDIEDLRGEDPKKMYDRLRNLRGQNIDRCVLYVFKCAINYVNSPDSDSELLKWWNWKD